jgi:hypothetical protein
MAGTTRTSGVGVAFVSDVQALRTKIPVIKNNKLKKDRLFIMSLWDARDNTNLIYLLTAACSCLKSVIHAMVLTKSASDLLCSRKARTAGPTGSSPAAPPGVSA